MMLREETTMLKQIRRKRQWRLVGVLALFCTLLGLAPQATLAAQGGDAGTYRNPLSIQIPGDGQVESCADPSLIRGQAPGDKYWYMYCTTDPLNDQDKTGGNFNFHLIS